MQARAVRAEDDSRDAGLRQQRGVGPLRSQRNPPHGRVVGRRSDDARDPRTCRGPLGIAAAQLDPVERRRGYVRPPGGLLLRQVQLQARPADRFPDVLLHAASLREIVTVNALVHGGYLEHPVDAIGLVLTEWGRDAAAQARCTCGHPLEGHTAAGCSYTAPADAAAAKCACPYQRRPVLLQAPHERG